MWHAIVFNRFAIRLFGLVSLVALLLSVVPLPAWAETAPEPADLTLALTDLGYHDVVVLRGTGAEVEFAFPLPETGISAAEVTLLVRPSPVVDPRSTVQFYIDDRPVAAVGVRQLWRDPAVTLTSGASARDYLVVRVGVHLFISENVCDDQRSDNLWAIIDPQSSLRMTYLPSAYSMRDFLRMPGGSLVFYGRWDSRANATASINLYSIVQHIYRHSSTQVLLAESAPARLAVPQREIHLTSAAAAPPLALADNVLTVRADQSGLAALLAEATNQPLLLGRSLNTYTHHPPATTLELAGVQQRSLADLGLPDQNFYGIGDLAATMRFTLADFGGWPANLRFDLRAAFDPVPTGTLERAFLRVYLNDSLIESFDIRGRSTLETTIHLPEHLLRVENYLQVTYAYAPLSGNCLGAPYNFNGQVRADSAFSWSGYGPSRGVLSEVIGTFHDQGSLLFLDDRPAYAQATAQLVGGLSRHTARPLVLGLSGAAETEPAAYRIVVGGVSPTTDPFALPLDLAATVKITNPQSGATLVDGTPDRPLAAIQYVPGDMPTLALQTSPAGDPALLAAAVERLLDPQRFFQFSGNVAVDNGAQLVVVRLTDAAGLQVTPSAPVAEWFIDWNDYRWLITILAIAAVVFIWSLVYRRLGQRPSQPGIGD